MTDEHTRGTGKRQKVLVIGLDGASPDVIRGIADEAGLVNIKRIIGSGVAGNLESVIPPITGPAWASFMTGKNPGRHSIYEFFKKKPDGYEYPINSTEVDSKTLWELLSDAGKDVVVINVPVTYPPRKVKGTLIADFLTPPSRRDFCYPDGVVEELEELFGPYRLYISEVYSPGRVDRVLDELFEVLKYRVDTARHLMKTRPWDFFMVHIWGTDRIQHELWHILDTTHPSHNRGEAEAFRKRILEYFKAVDDAIGELWEVAGEGSDLMVVSDHGFGPVEKFLSLNVWLMEQGFLRFRMSPLPVLKKILFKAGITPKLAYRISMLLGFARLRLSKGVGERVGLFRLVNRLFLSLRDADWSRTVAYSKGNYGQIFINLKGREPMGCVERGEQYERVVESVTAALKSAVDPETGREIIDRVYRADELYSGPHAAEAPDITFLPSDMRYKAMGSVDFITNRFMEPAYGNYGDHRVEGLFLAAGPSFRSSHAATGARLVDITPTVLYLLGVAVPEDLDGRVLTGCMDEVLVSRREVRYAKPGDAPVGGKEEFGDEENKEIRERLTNLGYMG